MTLGGIFKNGAAPVYYADQFKFVVLMILNVMRFKRR
jgi:hypothetical protein